MEQETLRELLSALIADWEHELVEFKEASNDYKPSEIAKYFSALSNEANLRGKERAWLVFGVKDKTRKITGTNFRPDHEQLQSLKGQIKQLTGSISFIDIHELEAEGKRVILFEIPAAPRGIPVLANGHAYARAGESLKALDFAQLDAIRNQTLIEDWSAQIVDEAKVDDLDETALKKARQDFIQKHKNRITPEEIEAWTEETFLGKLHLTRAGKLTRAAILLFGRHESCWGFLSPHPVQLTWRLEGPETAYEHFGLPFYLTTSALYSRIRNIQLRILPDDSLVSLELSKYDKDVVMEALHNCIIHQDYALNSRVVVAEYLDRLEFLSAGYFFEGKPSDYIEGKQTPQRYRNPCLAQAMAQLNMIDSMGMGIAKMYQSQAKRYFPLPDYELTASQVQLTIHGKIVDPAYSRLLIQHTGLPLSDILALDRIQKGLSITDERIIKHLRQKGLIEGRKPHFHISAAVAKVSQESSIEYVRIKRKHTAYYETQILEFLKLRSATRDAIEKLLFDQLGPAMSDEQKKKKIGNLLYRLGQKGKIKSSHRGKKACWQLVETQGTTRPEPVNI